MDSIDNQQHHSDNPAAISNSSTTSNSSTASSTKITRTPSSSKTPLLSFYDDLHVKYIVTITKEYNQSTSLEGAFTEHLKMSGLYWALTGLAIVRPITEINTFMNFDGFTSTSTTTTTTTTTSTTTRPTGALLDWIWNCYDNNSGGFGASIGHPGHILYTLSALQILALMNCLDDPRLQVNQIIDFIVHLQQPDGSFVGDPLFSNTTSTGVTLPSPTRRDNDTLVLDMEGMTIQTTTGGEIDTRFTYCALSSLAILQALDKIDVPRAVQYILQCQNLDGGFGAVVGSESHAGQIFCCIGALAIAQSLHLLSTNTIDLLCWWLAERQVDSGGLNGRPEKQADVCYSWWILSSLSILGRISWIHSDRLASFILQCQDPTDGGIADRPDDMADVFHTFFGIAGLSLLGYLHQPTNSQYTDYRPIDPIYALPTDVVQRLQLPGQVLVCSYSGPMDDRLSQYQKFQLS